jgi:hypothetical protein
MKKYYEEIYVFVKREREKFFGRINLFIYVEQIQHFLNVIN